MKVDQSLTKSRLDAAEMSGGASSDVLYGRIIGVLGQVGANGDVIDFGAGLGNLSRHLVSSGRFDHVAALDVMGIPDDLVGHVDWHMADLNTSTPLEEAVADCVVAVEVIEHLENPRFVAREWFRLLRPNGIVVMSTPNNGSFRSLLSLCLRGHFVAFLDTSYPAHITALVVTDLRRVLTEAGFVGAKVIYSDSGSIPGRPRTLWQKVLPWLRGQWFSDNVIVVARKPQAATFT
jgi:2-polyprenyl-3-methyl-5-hydroxy-6-metoxy-1,4-benzoquinol methylase